MTIGIALLMVALIPVVLAAFRVMESKQRPVVEPVAAPRRPSRPVHHALPPVTIETVPPAGLVPPIDRNVFAALAADMPRPTFARGSIPPGYEDVADDLDDDAETLRESSDLDDSAVTRANMQPVT